MKRFAVLTLVVLAVNGHAQPSPAQDSGQETDRQAINRVREQEIATFSSGEAEKLLALLTDDVVLMPPNEPAVVGKEAARAWVRNMFQRFKIEGTYTSTADLRLIGDSAFERMSFKLKLTPIDGGAPIEDVGKGVHVYRRQAGGAWKIAQDIWNSDKPVPAAK